MTGSKKPVDRGKGDAGGRKKRGRSVFREYVEAIVFALMIALVIKAFVIQAFKVDSGSMNPTLVEGDQMFINKFIYGTRIPFTDVKFFPVREPDRGDIIVFEYPNNRQVHYIKRLIGIPGDEIEIRDKAVYINGDKFEVEAACYNDSTILPGIAGPRDNFGPVTVPPDSYFMMGDNRDNSSDSRYWGYVDRSELLGRAFIIYWSWDIDAGGIFQRIKNIRWTRICTVLSSE